MDHVAMASLEPLVKHYEPLDLNIASICPLHPCRRMDAVNYFRHKAHSDMNLHGLMEYDKLAMLLLNAKQYDYPAPAIRLSALNDRFVTASPLMCTCTRAEQRVSYNTLPEVNQLNLQRKMELDFVKQLASTLQVVASWYHSIKITKNYSNMKLNNQKLNSKTLT